MAVALGGKAMEAQNEGEMPGVAALFIMFAFCAQGWVGVCYIVPVPFRNIIFKNEGEKNICRYVFIK